MSGYDRCVQPGDEIGQYRVEASLGSGGVADVWRVRHVDLGTLHALKVLRIATPSLRDRLIQEGRLQGALRHPNVLGVSDLVWVGGHPALVLEYVNGQPLSALLKFHRLTLDQVDALARGILAGVAVAHAAGLIHRDLKPANVLLAVLEDDVVPAVADFGLAKVADPGLSPSRTQTGAALGSPLYMAPEQLRDARSVDARADVFALGAILYALATGQEAFRDEDLAEIYGRIRDARYPPLRDLAPDLPVEMATAIERALSRDPDDRPVDAAALAALWIGARPAPRPEWPADLLQRLLRRDDDAPALDSATWVDESFQTSRPARLSPRRRRWWPVLAVVGAVALGAAAWTARGLVAPPVAATSGAYELAYQAFADSWLVDARRQADRVLASDPAHVDARVVRFCANMLDLDPAFDEDLVALASLGAGDDDAAWRARVFSRYVRGWDQADVDRYLDSHPDDLPAHAVLPISASWAGDDASRFARLDAATRRWPDAAVTWLTKSLMHSQREEVGSVDAALEDGLARTPDAPRLLLRRAEREVATGKIGEARTSILAVLAAEPGLYRARGLLATVQLLEGDEAGAAATTAAMRPEGVPPFARARFLARLSFVQLGLGRPAAADELLVEAIAVARAADLQGGIEAAQDTVARVDLALLAGTPGDARARLAELAQVTSNPGLGAEQRGWFEADHAEAAAVLAVLTGDLDAADAALPTLRQNDLAQRVEFLLAAARGHPPAAPLESAAETVCEDLWWTARAWRLVPGGGRAAHEAALASDPACGAVGRTAWFLVDSHAWLAREAAARGEEEEARRHARAILALWPSPEPGQPQRRIADEVLGEAP